MFQRKMHGGLAYYQAEDWQEMRHGIFTRHGGNSQSPFDSLNVGGTVGDDIPAVRANHQLMYDTLCVDAEMACTTWQVHGADVVVANSPVPHRRWLAQADALITNQPGIPLVQRFADCTPILYYDPHKNAIGLAHAGWRGTVKGVAANVIHAMKAAYACQPQDIQVVIGPSISVDCYQVGEEVVAAVQQYFGTTEGMVRRDPDDGTAYFDLWAANERALRQVGVQDVSVMGLCTYQTTADFYSHRAENGRTGRFGVVMTL